MAQIISQDRASFFHIHLQMLSLKAYTLNRLARGVESSVERSETLFHICLDVVGKLLQDLGDFLINEDVLVWQSC